MSQEAVVSVPGKTILFGEHAAVYGHAALVTALDHRMTVTAATPATLAPEALRLEIPALGIARTFPQVHAPTDLSEAGALAILAVAIGTEGLPRRATGLHVRIVSDIPSGAGFGSSAALAIAVVAACRQAWGVASSLDELARLASETESRQHTRASGVDVQAVLRGGVLWCRRTAGATLDYQPLEPKGSVLDAFRLFHSGAPVESTGEMVASVRRLQERAPALVHDAFEAIDAATHEGRSALERGDRDALVPAVRRAEAALETLGVVPAAVREVIRSIEAQGGAAKVSGAGGATGPGAGLVLVVHSDPEWHERFVPSAAWTAHRARLAAPGLRVEVAA